MTDNTTAPGEDELKQLKQDITDIIEFPQYPKGRIATRDLRGQPMSSTELGYKVSMIEERMQAYILAEVQKLIGPELSCERLTSKALIDARMSQNQLKRRLIEAAIARFGKSGTA